MKNFVWSPYHHLKYQIIDKFISISRLNQWTRVSARSLISYERVKVIICHKICNISIRTCYNRSRIPKYFLDMSANGSWLIESTLTSQHDIKSFFDLEIYLSTFNSLKHLKVHLTILTLQDYVIPSKRQYYGLLRSLRASTPSNNHLRPYTIRHGQRNVWN